MKRILWAFIAVVASMSLSGCGTMQGFGTKNTPKVTNIPATTNITPTSTDKPTPTKIEPTITSTEPAKPTVDPGFRNPVNATTEVFEGEAWFLKNAKGDPTAKWIVETKSWDTKDYEANITRTQVIVGNEVDQSILEPFLGPLPPDDPATHFKDANSNPVDYGVGPVIMKGSTVTIGHASVPTTEIFVRFRGAVSLPNNSNITAQIYEVPFVDVFVN
jgi:hypothetical protein